MENLEKNKKLLKIPVRKKIKYMDGIRLNRAITSGVKFLISRQDYLNKINVFPVPDGDTGTNMAFTLSSVMEASIDQIEPRVDIFTKKISDAAIDGARGNSGVLIAQFLLVLVKAVKVKKNLIVIRLSKHLKMVLYQQEKLWKIQKKELY